MKAGRRKRKETHRKVLHDETEMRIKRMPGTSEMEELGLFY